MIYNTNGVEQQDINPVEPPKTAKVYTGKDPMYDVLTRSKRTGVLDNEDGSFSTHRMEYNSTTDNGVTSYNVYPTLFQDIDGKWEDLTGGDAFGRAKSKNEVYSFDNEKAAQEFSKGSWKNDYKEYDTTSIEYKELYPNLVDSSEFAKSNYQTVPNEELETIQYVEEPSANNKKYRALYEKEFPKEKRIEGYLNGYSKLLGHTSTNYPERIDNEHEEAYNDYFYKKMEEGREGRSRGEWLDSLEPQDRRIAMRSKHSKQNIWEEVESGIRELTSMNGVTGTINNIVSNNNYTTSEKTELLGKLIDSPNMTSIVESSKALSVFDLPVRLIEGAIQSDYSMSDAMKGKYNDRSTLIGDIILDPTNYIGVGVLNKMGKASKIPMMTEGLVKKVDNIKNLSKGNKEKITESITKVLKSGRLDDSIESIINKVELDIKESTNLLGSVKEIDNIKPVANDITNKTTTRLRNAIDNLNENTEAFSKTIFKGDAKGVKAIEDVIKQTDIGSEKYSLLDATRDIIEKANKKSIESGDSSNIIGTSRSVDSFNVEKNGSITMTLTEGDKGSFSYLNKDGSVVNIENNKVNVNVNDKGIVTVKSSFTDELNEGLASDKKMLEEMFPGSKVIGSAEIAQKHNMIEMPGDIDITITKSDFDKIDTSGMDIRDTAGINKVLTITDKNGNKLEYDINIIDPGAVGDNAKLANEMQMYDYDGRFNGDAEAIFNSLDPEIKSLVDIFISKKDKNINKGDMVVSLSNRTDKVIEALELKGKIYAGEDYRPLGNIEFGSYEDNLKLLEEMDFVGYNGIVALNPDKMKAAVIQFYNDNTILARNITASTPNNLQPSTSIGKMNEADRSAMTRWRLNNGGASSSSGAGLNTVALGDPEFLKSEGVYKGFIQPNPKITSTKAEEIVKQIKDRFVDKTITPEENNKIITKLKELQPESSIIGTNKDATKISDYSRVIDVEFHNWLSKEFNIASTEGSTFGNSKYRGVVGEEHYNDAAVRIMDRSKTESPKSKRQREEAFKNGRNIDIYGKLVDLKDKGITSGGKSTITDSKELDTFILETVKDVETNSSIDIGKSYNKTIDTLDESVKPILERMVTGSGNVITLKDIDVVNTAILKQVRDNELFKNTSTKAIFDKYGVDQGSLFNELSSSKYLLESIESSKNTIGEFKYRNEQLTNVYNALKEIDKETREALMVLSKLKRKSDYIAFDLEFKPGMTNFGKANSGRKISNNKE